MRPLRSSVRHSAPPATALAAALAALLSMALAGCARKELSERPGHGGAAVATFTPRPSMIAATASVPLAGLAKLINDQVPASFSAGGNGQDVCLGPLCAGTRYEIAVRRTGPVELSAAGPRTLRVSMPIAFSGQGGLRGDGARLLKLDAKNFDGALVARADLALSPGQDWCPTLAASVTHAWTSNPRVEILERVNVDITGPVESAIADKLPGLIAAARNAIDCQRFRREAASLYASRTFPLQVPHLGTIHLNIMPRGMGISGLQVQPDAVTIGAVMRADVELARQALTPGVLPLPAPDAVAADAVPKLAVSVLLRAPYPTLSAALAQAVAARPFVTETPAGKVAVQLTAVEAYPSGGRVAIALSVNADLPSSLLDVKGNIYLTGTPVVGQGTRIAFPDAAFTPGLDTAFWNAASLAFHGPLQRALRQTAFYDFKPDLERARQALLQGLRTAPLGPGLALSADDIDMRLGRIAVGGDELMVEGLLDARVTLSMKGAP